MIHAFRHQLRYLSHLRQIAVSRNAAALMKTDLAFLQLKSEKTEPKLLCLLDVLRRAAEGVEGRIAGKLVELRTGTARSELIRSE